jgi:L-lactate dehydrogenase complex protein LldE
MRTVLLFIPCYVDTFHPRVGRAAVQLLEENGCQVRFPVGQTCCGQPAFNTGYRQEARRVGEHFCRIFQQALEEAGGEAEIVAPSSSCVAMVREHFRPLGLATPAPTFEMCDYLAQVLGARPRARVPRRAALYSSCHLQRVLDGDGSVRQLLAGVEGLTLVATGEEESCCGFGGTFSVTQPEVSAAMGRQKLQAAARADVDLIITTDASCGMQLAGLAGRTQPEIQVVHVAEVLAGMVT